MKSCEKCHRAYSDSVNFCRIDGDPLISKGPPYSEAVTQKMTPGQKGMSPEDVQMEIANLLRGTVDAHDTLIRFEQLTSLGLTIRQISDNFEEGAKKADCIVISKTSTRATVRHTLNPTHP